jgi:hypothetical protein
MTADQLGPIRRFVSRLKVHGLAFVLVLVAGADGASGSEYSTANFVIKAPNAQLAERVGLAAEKQRKALALLWLGKELPAWTKPCAVRVQLHGGPSGACVIQYGVGEVVAQEMMLDGTAEQILKDLVAHEVTHLLLAHHFGWPVPRWADEGAALLAESAETRAREERRLAKLQEEGRLLPLAKLLPMRDYPRDVWALYAQGSSLTAFLIATADRKQFLAFVAAGRKGGWDKAAADVYGYHDVAGLETAWLTWVADTRTR